MRFAIYFAPQPDSALAGFGRWWLDAPPSLDGLTPKRWQEITASPRRYGFHATLKAPFTLVASAEREVLYARLAAFAAARRAFRAPPLAVGELDGFLALVPQAEDDGLRALAAACVQEFDDLRAPPAPGELARRRAAGLTARQDANLRRWGYPYVLDEFRFHMTLTERLQAAERRRMSAILGARFVEMVAAPLAVGGVSLFVEAAQGAPFRELARYPFSR